MLKAKLREVTFPVSTQALAFTLRLRLHEFGQLFERTKTYTDPPFVNKDPRNSASFLTADSTAICNRICMVTCKRLAQVKNSSVQICQLFTVPFFRKIVEIERSASRAGKFYLGGGEGKYKSRRPPYRYIRSQDGHPYR